MRKCRNCSCPVNSTCSRIRTAAFAFSISAFMLATLGRLPFCRGAIVALPSPGTNINYDYATSTPAFAIFTDTPNSEVLEGTVTFSGGSHLQIEFEPSSPNLVVVDLRLFALGIESHFDPVHISFNETMALLLNDGASGDSVNNVAIGWNESGSEYSFRWQFELPSNRDIYGFSWKITPDLISGEILPATLDARFDVFASLAVIVVPEPPSFAIGLTALAMMLSIRKRLSHCELMRTGMLGSCDAIIS